MDVAGEVAIIAGMVITLILGLLLISWVYGDFERPKKPSH